MTLWSFPEILQRGTFVPSSGNLLAPSVDASGAKDGNRDGKEEVPPRQPPKFCSVSTPAGKKCD